MAPSARLRSLDAFRGITIAAMIVVNSPGNNKAYPFLAHAQWDGCTLADLVFPCFLFIVGVSLCFALSSRRGTPLGPLLKPILRRAALLCALGLLLNAIPNYHPATFRFAGVLQRIAVCYVLASLLFLCMGLRGLVLLTTVLLLGYWAALAFISVPGFGPGVLTQVGSLPSYIDRSLMGSHTYFKGPIDPEGFLSTFPALATTLLGVLAGGWLRGGRSPEDKAFGLVGAGVVALLLGSLWSEFLPLNKQLWSSSYAVFTAGMAAVVLGLSYWTIDVRGWTSWGKPFEVFGANAIAAYVLHLLVLKALVYTRVSVGGAPVSPRILLCDTLFGTWLSPLNASLAFALSYTLFWLAVMWGLHRRGLFLKV